MLSVFRKLHSVILNAALILSTAVLVLSNHFPLQNVLTNHKSATLSVKECSILNRGAFFWILKINVDFLVLSDCDCFAALTIQSLYPSSPLNKANIFLNFLILIKCFILTNHYIILMLHNLLMKIWRVIYVTSMHSDWEGWGWLGSG